MTQKEAHDVADDLRKDTTIHLNIFMDAVIILDDRVAELEAGKAEAALKQIKAERNALRKLQQEGIDWTDAAIVGLEASTINLSEKLKKAQARIRELEERLQKIGKGEEMFEREIEELKADASRLATMIIQKTTENSSLILKVAELEAQRDELKAKVKSLTQMGATFIS